MDEARALAGQGRRWWTCARPTSGPRATARGRARAARVPGAAHRGEGPGQRPAVVLYCAGGTRSALAARSLPSWATRTSSRSPAASARGRRRALPVVVPRVLARSSATATAATCWCPRSARPGRRGSSTSKVLLVGAGGLGSPGRALPGGGRRGHDRHRRLRRGGPLQPAAAGAAHHRPAWARPRPSRPRSPSARSTPT